MRVEKRIKDQASAGDKKSDVDAREFANEVFAALGEMVTHEIVEGQADTEAERLAAVLTFLQTLILEYTRHVRTNPDLLKAEPERVRVAVEAMTMLRDIAGKRRHPVHRFFRGAAQHLQSRQPTSREMAKECILIAAVGALVKAGSQQEMKPAAAIRLLKSRAGIGEHMPSDDAFTKVLSRRETEPDYIEYVQDCRDMISWVDDSNTEAILSWTAMALSARERPLDRAAATTVKPIRAIRMGLSGTPVLMAPRALPFPLLSSTKALMAKRLPMPPRQKGPRP